MAEEPEAITVEDEDPLDAIGEEADPPEEAGRAPGKEDEYPPEEGEEPEEEPEPEAGALWRVATALTQLRREIDGRWPNRDHRSDGTIGDANHCGPGRSSDHCRNSAGVVRALDVDVDGITAAWLAEHVRKRGANGDPRLANGGYVIFNRRIASWSHGWRWRAYNGDNPHTSHIHFSVSQSGSGYDGTGAWGVRAAPVPGGGGTTTPGLPTHALGSRVLRLASPPMRGTDVGFVQRWVGTEDTGSFAPETDERVKRYQRIVGLEPTGVVDERTWRSMRVT